MSVGSIEANNATLSTFGSAAKSGARGKSAFIFMAVLVLYVIIRGLRAAAATPLWFDEFFTLTIASQASLHDMWAVLARGFDSQPPLFYLVERLALNLPIKKEVALRLPSILAFPCIMTCVFAYVAKRTGELIACLCAFLLLSTSLFHTYTIDARPYTMAVASIAFALVCYQRLPSRLWTVLFAASLLLAESLHYYAIFAMIPFWFAEGIRLLRTRRLRWPVWLALVLGPVPLIPALPVLSKSRLLYGTHFFARPVFSRVPDYYGAFFAADRVSGLALLAVSLAAIVWWMLDSNRQDMLESPDRDSSTSEGALLLGLNLLPIISFVLARVAHGALLERYVLATTIGMILGVSCALSLIRSNAAVVFLALFLLVTVSLRERTFWLQSGQDSLSDSHYSAQSGAEFAQVQTLVQTAGHPDLAVLIDYGPIYFQMVYYSPPNFTTRLVYLTDREKELRYHGTDTTVKIFELCRDYFPLRLVDYTEFTRAHSEFLVYSAPEGWMLDAMRRDGASIQSLKNNGVHTVYLVKMRAAFAQ